MKRHLLLLPATLLLLIALWSGLGQISFLRDPTTKKDWLNAARHVREQIQKDEEPRRDAPGTGAASKHAPTNQPRTTQALPMDRILVWPAWRETPLPELVEVSQSLLWNDRPVLEDLQRVHRLFLLVPTARVDEALEALPFDAQGSITSRQSFDTVQAIELTLSRERTQWGAQLSDHLARATVNTLIKDGTKPPKTTRCALSSRGAKGPSWRCPDIPEEVSASFYELDDQPRYCILAHPPKGTRGALSITFPDLPLTTPPPGATSAPLLRLRAGFDLRGARLAPQNDELSLQIFVGDEQLAHRHYKAQTSTWEVADIPIARRHLLEGSLRGLRFEISANQSEHKLFCFNAWLGAPPDQAQR